MTQTIVRVAAVEEQVESVEVAVRRLERMLGSALTVACAWELLALTTKVLPPLSRGMWRLRPLYRLVAWVAIVAIGTDHFFTRRFV